MSEDENYDASSSCESEGDNENDTLPNTNDWIIVNLISMRKLTYRYVGQILTLTDIGFIVIC